MSFAILGANAALVPNRVRIAKANNTRDVSTVTVAVRPTFPALDASPTSIRYRHASCARYLDRLVSVPLAPLETRVSTEDPVRFFSIARNRRGAGDLLFCSFPFLRDWVHMKKRPKIRRFGFFAKKRAPRRRPPAMTTDDD